MRKDPLVDGPHVLSHRATFVHLVCIRDEIRSVLFLVDAICAVHAVGAIGTVRIHGRRHGGDRQGSGRGQREKRGGSQERRG